MTENVLRGAILLGNNVMLGKPPCPNTFSLPIFLSGLGNSKKKAEDAFAEYLKSLPDAVKDALKCGDNQCTNGDCEYAYFLNDDYECKERLMEPKKKKLWVARQTGLAGCFCDDVY